MSKKKEAQKLAAWALLKIAELTKKSQSKENSKTKHSSTSNDDIGALETAFGNLDAKLN